MTSLNVDIGSSPYHAMLGVGGIGSGSFFALYGDHTLGREESRSGHFLDRRDYCKLHIISHYVKVLLGPDFAVLPIGYVGEDPPGLRLMQEMASAGLDLRHVRALPAEQTLFSFCFIYPDGSGGNLTIDNSACDRLDAAAVLRAEADFALHSGHGIALAAPEVPLAARHALLQVAARYGFLRVAAFTSGEMAEVLQCGLLKEVDLLALNRDEAAALVGTSSPHTVAALENLAELTRKRLQQLNPTLCFTLTAGDQGSWSYDGTALHRLEAFPTRVAGTAGAGDAFLAGVLAGLSAGLPLCLAHELGSLTAAKSVTSPHTIDPDLDARSLACFSRAGCSPISNAVRALLPENIG